MSRDLMEDAIAGLERTMDIRSVLEELQYKGGNKAIISRAKQDLIKVEKTLPKLKRGVAIASYENSQSMEFNIIVAIEAADNVFVRFWKWIKELFKNLFSSSSSDSSEAQESVDKYQDKIDTLLSKYKKYKKWNDFVITDGNKDLMKEHLTGLAVLAQTDKLTKSGLQKIINTLKSYKRPTVWIELEKYINGAKIEDLNLDKKDSNGFQKLYDNRENLFKSSSTINTYKPDALLSLDLVYVDNDSVKFLLVEHAENSSEALKITVVTGEVKDEVTSKLGVQTAPVEFKTLDALADTITSTLLVDPSAITDRYDEIKELLKEAKENDKKTPKRLAEIHKPLKILSKPIIFMEAKLLRTYYSYLTVFSDGLKEHNTESGNETDYTNIIL